MSIRVFFKIAFIIQFVLISSFAQESNSKNDSIERVQVLGTRIKKINTEGPSAVKNFKKEQIAESPNTTVSDILRDSNLATFGVAREESGSNAAGTTNIGLRGLGATRTLVLLNGARLPKDPDTQAVDLNLIPTAAIERIEVLKDGSSALYGSDALGGVINIVTKKNVKGGIFALKQTSIELPGGSTTDLSYTTGSSNENSDSLIVLNYSKTDKILGNDREVTRPGLSATGIAPSYRENGIWNVIGDCPPELLQPAPTGGGVNCFYNFNATASVRPEISQFKVLTQNEQRINSNFNLYNRNLVVFKDIRWNYAPYPIRLEVSSTASRPNAEFVAYRLVDAGNREFQTEEKTYSTLLGFKGQINDIWDYDFSSGYTLIQRASANRSGWFSDTRLRELINNGTYDPLNQNNPGDFRSAATQGFFDSRSALFTNDLIITGELGELEEGPVGLAMGMSTFHENFAFESDLQSVIDAEQDPSDAKQNYGRDVYSIFAETSIPLFKDFELNLAGRLDRYSDFGETFNPKIAAKYILNKSTLLRASVGTGFKAPTLSQLYSLQGLGLARFIDRVACTANGPQSTSCRETEYDVTFSGNRNLKEEKAFTMGTGIVYEPDPDFNFALDLWYTKIDNVVGIDYEALTEVELRDPSIPAGLGIEIIRDAQGGLQRVKAPNLNLQQEQISGLDMTNEIQISPNLLGYRFSFEDELSYLFFYKREGFPGAGVRDILGEWSFPRWRNTARFKLQNNKVIYTVGLRTIPGQNVLDRNSDEKINDLNEVDFNLAYKYSKTANFTFGVKNVFNTDQPADPTGGGGGVPLVNNALYDINNRVITFGYVQDIN